MCVCVILITINCAQIKRYLSLFYLHACLYSLFIFRFRFFSYIFPFPLPSSNHLAMLSRTNLRLEIIIVVIIIGHVIKCSLFKDSKRKLKTPQLNEEFYFEKLDSHEMFAEQIVIETHLHSLTMSTLQLHLLLGFFYLSFFFFCFLILKYIHASGEHYILPCSPRH